MQLIDQNLELWQMPYKDVNMTGIELIKKFEGLRLESYKCPAGVWTIGYGTTKGIKEGQKITKEQAEKMLMDTYLQCESQVAKMVTVPLKQHQLDALVSFVYNLGQGALRGSTLLRRLNSGNYSGAAEEFDKWVFANGVKLKGLVARRQAERDMFEGG